jgi:predicted RNA-binding protein with RPS1 domain
VRPAISPALRRAILRNRANRSAAAANKERRLPKQVKKRRLLVRYKDAQRASKRELRVNRAVDVKSPDRRPLEDLRPDEVITGQCISITAFGAYLDVNTSLDGLLHLRDMSADTFVTSADAFVRPGDFLDVYVKYAVPPGGAGGDRGKLALSLVPPEERWSERPSDDPTLLPLDAFDLSDEVWGTVCMVNVYEQSEASERASEASAKTVQLHLPIVCWARSRTEGSAASARRLLGSLAHRRFSCVCPLFAGLAHAQKGQPHLPIVRWARSRTEGSAASAHRE